MRSVTVKDFMLCHLRIYRHLRAVVDRLPATSRHDLELQWMKHVESQWKPLEQERSQVREGKQWLLLNDDPNVWPMRILE
jgi:CRISPR/Cas system-associated exonuclease Cas4 (RecB family)